MSELKIFECHCGCGKIVETTKATRKYFSSACNARVHSAKIDIETKRAYYRLYEATMRDKARHNKHRQDKSTAKKLQSDRKCKYCNAELPLEKRLGVKFCNSEHSWGFFKYGPLSYDNFVYDLQVDKNKVALKIDAKTTVIVDKDKVQATLEKYAKHNEIRYGIAQETDKLIQEELEKFERITPD